MINKKSSASKLVNNLLPSRLLLMTLIPLALYLLYSFIILSPFSYNFFSLIDDGQSFHNTQIIKRCFSKFECSEVTPIIIEKEFGRFRPAYWLINSGLFLMGNLDPTLIHAWRIIFFGFLLCTLLVLNIYSISKSVVGAIVGTSIFYSNISFTENIIRIGPTEPIQLFFIGIFSLFFLNFKALTKRFNKNNLVLFMSFLLLISIMVKETTIAMLPIIAVFLVISPSKFTRNQWITLISPFSILFLGKALAQSNNEFTQYDSFYSFSITSLAENLHAYLKIIFASIKWYLPSLLPALLLIIMRNSIVSSCTKKIIFWILFIFSFLLILLPWGFVLERYLLLVFFGLGVIFGSAFGIITTKFWEYLTRVIQQRKNQHFAVMLKLFSFFIIILIITNVFFLAQLTNLIRSKNFSMWYSHYIKYEHTLVAIISKYSDTIHLNALPILDNWEVSYEIPIHLHYFYDKTNNTQLASKNLNSGDFVITTSSLIQIPEITALLQQNSIEITQNNAVIKQLDIINFRSSFRQKPVQTILDPPYTDNPITHSWLLSKIK
jgi:hypothetical protein